LFPTIWRRIEKRLHMCWKRAGVQEEASVEIGRVKLKRVDEGAPSGEVEEGEGVW
jgi:hypothetical protein